MKLLRRHLLRVGRLTLLGLLLVLLVAVAAVLYLQTEAGEARLLGKVLQEANRVVSGRLSARDVDLQLGGRIVLLDAELRDPEGRLVARVARLEADVD
ncbi:MAG: hypothetical protein ACK4N5_08455, partial [Myxococcales bacterium]